MSSGDNFADFSGTANLSSTYLSTGMRGSVGSHLLFGWRSVVMTNIPEA